MEKWIIFLFLLTTSTALDVISLEESKSLENSLEHYHPLFKSVHVTEVKYDEVSNKTVHTRLHRITPIIFARPRSLTDDNDTEEVCTDSLDDFPQIFTEEQLRKGFFVIAFPIGIYCFTLLAVICDSYFIPCVERICEALNLSQDVAAATFMSVATSTPELFVNIIGTFITESDVGIGTVVGSSLFNTLGVAAIGSLCASAPIKVDWWPVTRDIMLYICAIVLLVTMTWDGVIFWYEGMILFIAYFVYFSVMFQNTRMSNAVHDFVEKRKQRQQEQKKPPIDGTTINVKIESVYAGYSDEPIKYFVEHKEEPTKNDKEEEFSLWRIPQGSLWKKLFFFYLWPIKALFSFTVPDPKKYPKWFPVTFLMCILWIGVNSYMVSWMITIIGHIFGIPDAVLGLTFLAAGGCLPESISLAIMSRKGEGGMGISNALGANTMNILLSLGMPWFLKTIMMGANSSSFIRIDSGSIEYTILALVAVACILFTCLYFNKFRLSRKLGIVLAIIYTVCIVMAILSEMVFFESLDC